MMSGMSFSPADLVGIPFPYSDLKTEKRRPVLVMTPPDRRGDFICAAVTSVFTPELAVAICDALVEMLAAQGGGPEGPPPGGPEMGGPGMGGR